MPRQLAPGEARRLEVAALGCRCTRCDAEFVVVGSRLDDEPSAPARCRECRSPYWRIPRGTLQRGRPRVMSEATCVRCARRFAFRASEAKARPDGWELDARCTACRTPLGR